ncbi:hypothetical protein DFH08DRAFT_790363 [Mycena albidolilacea]|uniref:Uncharacterized protein n=1 Tax=Mycena albidolilacea TaxID=1033008 RepID=A0AAD6ZBU4_9AGAR|nr:hypothetical protein DFH08DRAFT_790363 [Mycena albidolilacea]
MVLDVLVGSETDLSDRETVCSVGTIAPREYDALETIAARNARVIGVVRAVSAVDGPFAGWAYLARIASNVRLPGSLVADVARGIALYPNLRPSVPPSGPPTELYAVITRAGLRDSITAVPPKTLGGRTWMQSVVYTAVLQRWSNAPGFAPIGPCMAFGFLGIQRKMLQRVDIGECDALMYLGSLVDYDLDSVDEYSPGFVRAMEIALRSVVHVGGDMQGMALASLVNLDVQLHNREVQKRWIGKRAGWHVHGDMSADEWASTVLTDCGALCAFGYEPAGVYPESRLGMFAATIVASSYDVLYDRATYQLAAPMMYVEAVGMATYNMHCIFTTFALDAVAMRISGLQEGAIPLFGDNSLLVTAAWSPFNVRYHTWERFVKYSHQITRSSGTSVRNVTAMAKKSLVLPCSDIAEAWRQANTRGAEATLIPRITTRYTPSPTQDIASVPQPQLCSSCKQGFAEAIQAFETDEIHATDGIPASVINCKAVAIAAAIRRASLFASGDGCCDVCACRIGCWADEVSPEVMMALMESEDNTSASEWLLQCYAVACIPLMPMSVPSILSGFDLLCEVKEHEGAMGARDVLDI